MIDKDKFATGMGLLCGAFSRTLDAAVSRAYYAVLNPALSTDEFERAVSLTLSTETFWPSPALLLNKIKADDECKGALAFEHVNRVTNSVGGYRYMPFERYEREFDAPTKHAILAVGGLPAIANTNEDRWASLQRRFVAAYQAHGKPVLTSGNEQTDGRVKQLVGSVAGILSGRDRAAGERHD